MGKPPSRRTRNPLTQAELNRRVDPRVLHDLGYDDVDDLVDELGEESPPKGYERFRQKTHHPSGEGMDVGGSPPRLSLVPQIVEIVEVIDDAPVHTDADFDRAMSEPIDDESLMVQEEELPPSDTNYWASQKQKSIGKEAIRFLRER